MQATLTWQRQLQVSTAVLAWHGYMGPHHSLLDIGLHGPGKASNILDVIVVTMCMCACVTIYTYMEMYTMYVFYSCMYSFLIQAAKLQSSPVLKHSCVPWTHSITVAG